MEAILNSVDMLLVTSALVLFNLWLIVALVFYIKEKKQELK